MKVLWGTKRGAEFWQEDILTTQGDRFTAATTWARAQGFTNIRISDDGDGPPDFAATVRGQGHTIPHTAYHTKGDLMTYQALLTAYRETGNERFLQRAIKLMKG